MCVYKFTEAMMMIREKKLEIDGHWIKGQHIHMHVMEMTR
jgi:hypothetical protein